MRSTRSRDLNPPRQPQPSSALALSQPSSLPAPLSRPRSLPGCREARIAGRPESPIALRLVPTPTAAAQAAQKSRSCDCSSGIEDGHVGNGSNLAVVGDGPVDVEPDLIADANPWANPNFPFRPSGHLVVLNVGKAHGEDGVAYAGQVGCQGEVIGPTDAAAWRASVWSRPVSTSLDIDR